MVERGFLVRGRVQGVGFRWWTKSTADRMGVEGTVRNLRDGSVEVMARAEEDVMERFADELHGGPGMARVDDVDEIAYKLAGAVRSFTIER